MIGIKDHWPCFYWLRRCGNITACFFSIIVLYKAVWVVRLQPGKSAAYKYGYQDYFFAEWHCISFT